MFLLKAVTVFTAISFSLAMTDSEVHQRFNLLFKEIAGLKKSIAHQSAFCSTFKTDPCGPCTCLDEPRQYNGYYCDCQHISPKRDCLAFFTSGFKVDGLYKITMNSWYQGKVFRVWCDQTTDGGGWTVFQRRNDASTDFYRLWDEYKEGFGELVNNFWLGNEKLHDVIHQGHLKGNELRVDMKRFTKTVYYAKYSTFSVDDEANKYKLTVGGYSGTIADYLTYHNGMKFSTRDQDNDVYSSFNCAGNRGGRGGWWFKSCINSHLNGIYNIYGGTVISSGVYWGGSVSWSEMKVRRKV